MEQIAFGKILHDDENKIVLSNGPKGGDDVGMRAYALVEEDLALLKDIVLDTRQDAFDGDVPVGSELLCPIDNAECALAKDRTQLDRPFVDSLAN